jgi:hypothetical protein
MFSTSTFVNPYVSMQDHGLKHIPESKRNSLSPHWIRKIDINQIQVHTQLSRKKKY